jgi:hypothetical protein
MVNTSRAAHFTSGQSRDLWLFNSCGGTPNLVHTCTVAYLHTGEGEQEDSTSHGGRFDPPQYVKIAGLNTVV